MAGITHTSVEAGAGASRTRMSGLYGITAGQTMRLTVVNIHITETITARMGWTQNPPVASKEVTLAPGESAHLDVTAGQVRKAVPDSFDRYGRTELRATVTSLDRDSLSFLATIQVFDDETGRTTIAQEMPPAPAP